PLLVSLSGAGEEHEGGDERLSMLPAGGDVAEAAEARAAAAAIEAQVRRLPPLYKAAFRGRLERSMTDGELATHLRVRRAEVENLVRKACLLLRRRISRVDCSLTTTFVRTNTPGVNRSVKSDFRMDEPTWDALGQLAKKQRVKRSEAVRRLLEASA